MALRGGTSQACAACKYQRRRCTVECPLALYFPPDQPKMFQNAHKLFGVSNIVKILKNLNPSQKDEAMSSIIYQANIREKFPVHGCLEVICWLRYQIQLMEEELHAVYSQLEIYRQHNYNHMQISSYHDDHDVTSQLELGMGPPNNALSLFNQVPQSYNGGAYNSGFLDSKDNLGNALWVQHGYGKIGMSNNSMGNHSHLGALQPLAIQKEEVVDQDYDEMHPFFDIIDDRQSYNIDSKEAYDTSSEESLKDTTLSMEHVAENELKSAAACFSLTNAN